MPPLEPVHRSQIAFAPVSQATLLQKLFRPVPIPDLDTLLAQELRVGTAPDEPEEFVDDALQEGALGGKKREGGRRKGEAERRGREDGERASASAVRAGFASGEDARYEREVLVFLMLRIRGRGR